MASSSGNPGAGFYRLTDEEGVGEGLRRVALGCADDALQALADVEEDFGASVHRARKDLKKLRAVLRLVRSDLGKKAFRAENQRYREAGRLLSGSRDATAKLGTLAALGDRFGAELPAAATRDWRVDLERERDRLARLVADEAATAIAQARAEIEEGRRRIAGWALEDASWKLVGTGLGKSYRRGRKALAKTREDPDAENLHEWRKRTKDSWYQLRILRGAWPPVIGEAADQAHDLADLLGDHHDLVVLGADLASRQIEESVTFEALIDRRQGELLEQALALGARLYAERPRAFERRFHSYWRAWRADLHT
jgi:CHAD domain-containing protein